MKRMPLLILALLAAFPAEAQTLRAQNYSLLVASRSSSHAADQPVDLAYVIDPDAGWHIYWVNPGDIGYQPAISWNLPGDWQAGGLRHPAPRRLVLGGYSSNVHEGRAILLQSLTGPSGDVRVKGALDLLVCSASTCVPDPLNFALTLPEGDNAADSATGPNFAEAQAATPRAGRAGALFAPAGPHLRVFLPGVVLAVGERAHLFSAVAQVIDEAAGQSFRRGEGGLFVDLPMGQAMVANRLPLLLRIDGAQGSVKAWQFAAAQGPLPDAATPISAGAVSLAGLEALFHAYRPELRRFVVAQTGNRAEAEDILQEMCVRVRKPGGVTNPRPYLYRMARNPVIDRLRETQRMRRRDRGWSDHLQPGDEPADRTGNAEHQLLAREELALLASGLTTISHGARRALELHKLDGLSQAEVAERLGISISGVEKHIAVAMKYPQ